MNGDAFSTIAQGLIGGGVASVLVVVVLAFLRRAAG